MARWLLSQRPLLKTAFLCNWIFLPKYGDTTTCFKPKHDLLLNLTKWFVCLNIKERKVATSIHVKFQISVVLLRRVWHCFQCCMYYRHTSNFPWFGLWRVLIVGHCTLGSLLIVIMFDLIKLSELAAVHSLNSAF